MQINYIVSDLTKSATSKALQEVCRLAERDVLGSVIVIVPETKSIIIERELLSLSKNGSYANVFVYSFVRLLDRLGAVPQEKMLSKQSAIILLRKIIYDNFNKLTCYKKTAKTIGFAEKMYETIAQFKSSEITPEKLKLSLETTKKSFCAKLKDIILLYEAYETEISEKFFDDLDKLSLLSKFAKENKFLAGSDVFVVGFDNITFEMQRVLKDLAKNSKSITFSSVYFNDKRPDKYIQQNDLFNKFKHIADELKIPYQPYFARSNKKGDFFFIQNRLFCPKFDKQKYNGDVHIFEANTKKQELDFVANTILCGINNGRRFKDFGVLLADSETDIELLKKCFDVYKIPYFANSPTKIEGHFLIKFIKNAFMLNITHLSSETVLEFMASPLFGANDFSLVKSFVDETGTNYGEFLEEIDENYLNKHRSYYEQLNKLGADEENTAADSFSELLNKLDKLKFDLDKFKNFYSEIQNLLQNCHKTAEFLRIIEVLFEKFDIFTKMESLAKTQRELQMTVEAEVSEQILKILSRVFDQMKNFLGETTLSIQEFLGIFESVISAITISVAPVSIDAVIIQNNTDGFFDIKEMFIVGASDGCFPSKIQDSGIILDSELEEAKRLIKSSVEPTIKEINVRERFRVYESLLEPSEKLYISYAKTSNAGKQVFPSNIIKNLEALFGEEIKLKAYERVPFVNFDILERKFSKLAGDYLGGTENSTEAEKIYNRLGDKISPELQNFLDLLTFNAAFKTKRGEELYFFDDKTSVSQIQTYFDCPYKFFVRYGLKLKQKRLAKLNFPDIGTLIHRVVELFGRNIDFYKKLDETALKNEILQLLNKVLDESKINREKNKSLVKILGDECERLLNYILFEQNNSNFKIQSNEFVFSGKNAVKLVLSNGKILNLQGKIDRIDVFQDHIRIIDYKTGNISSDLKSIYFGTKIQLSSYLEAIKSEKKKVAGLFYFPVHSDYSKDEKSSQKEYRLTGFILDDIDVAKNMDISLSENNLKSNFAPVWIKFDKEGQMLFDGRQKRYSEKEFELMNNYVNLLCRQACEEALEGNIEPSPIANEDGEVPSSCANCEVCGFCGLEKSSHKLGRSLAQKIDILSFDLGEQSGGN